MIHHSTNEEDKKWKKKKNEKKPKNSSLFLILDFQLWDSNLCVCVCVWVAFCWWLFVCCRLVVVWCWRKSKNPWDLNFFFLGLVVVWWWRWTTLMFERLLVFGNEEHLIFERLLVFGIEDEEHWSLRDCCCCLVFRSLHSLKSNLNFFLRILQICFFVGFAVQESSIFEAIVAAAVVGCCWRIFNPWGSCYWYCCWVLKSRLWGTLLLLLWVWKS
jgi:hypothetical protein